jgi:phage terminase small subunit
LILKYIFLKGDLTDKQKRFCDEYLIDFNGAAAARRAGYSARTAHEQAAQLLAKLSIQDYLNKKKERVATKLDISLEKVVTEYAKIAFFDIRKVYDESNQLIDISQLDDNSAGALAGIETESRTIGSDKDNVVDITTKKVKVWDKRAALDSICRVLGYNAPEKRELTGKDGKPIQTELVSNINLGELSDEVLESIMNARKKSE